MTVRPARGPGGRGRGRGSRTAGRRRAGRARRCARRPRPARMPAASRPRLVGTLARPLVAEPLAGRRPGRCGRAAGRGPGPCRGRRARCPGAAPTGTRASGRAAWMAARRPRRRRRRSRPATARPRIDGDRCPAQERGRRRDGRRLDAPDGELGGARERAPRTTSPSARAVQAAWWPRGRTRWPAGRQLDERDAVLDHGVAEAQEEDRQLFLGVGAEEDDRAARARRPRRSWRGAGRAPPRPAGRRRAGRRRCRCRSRPWPAWPRRRPPRW